MLPALTLILLLAALLRIYNITQQSIWFDEAFAWNIVIQDAMYPRIAADTHPPLYYVLLRGWMTAAGDSPLALRYLSALIGLMTVALVYQVGRELVRGRDSMTWASVPALAALVIALSDAEIFLAQEARNYTLYTFFATLSMWAYLRWLRKPSAWSAAGWALSTAALAYTHYQGLFIPAIQGMHVLLFLRGRQRIHALGLLAAAGVIFLPWFLGVTVPQAQNAIDNSLPYSIATNWDTLLHLRNNYLGAQWPLMILLALAGIAALASRDGLPRRESWGRALMVVMWFALPFCVLFFGNLFASLLTERKLLIIVPAVSLLIAFGLGGFDRRARALLVAVIVIGGLTSVDYYRVKEPWDRISAEAAAYAHPSDLALIEVGVGQYPMKYYWQRTMPDGVVISTFPVLGDFTMGQTDWYTHYTALLPFLFDAQQSGLDDGEIATAWLVFWSRERAAIERLEEAGYTRTMTVTYDHLGNDIDLYRYDILPPGTFAAFENGMTLHAVRIDPNALRVDLWWSAGEALAADYTVSALLLDESGQLVAQLDSFPFRGERPTRGWTPGEIVYDPRALQLKEGRDSLPPGTYTAAVQVYRWTPDGALQHALPLDSEAEYVIVGSFGR
jgi:mannosyltransferase